MAAWNQSNGRHCRMCGCPLMGRQRKYCTSCADALYEKNSDRKGRERVKRLSAIRQGAKKCAQTT